MDAKNDPLVLAKRAFDHYKAGTTDQAPTTYTVPVEAYFDPERYRREWEAVFLRNPLPIGVSVELPDAGSYRAVTLMGKPVMLVRGSDRVVRAFLNVCTHRGAALCEDGMGKKKLFSCPYHSWTFDTQGKLVSIPAEEIFGDLDKSKLGLTALPCAERAGLIWACMTPGAEFDIDAWLGDFRERLEALKLDKHHIFKTWSFPGPVWKVAMDGYLEVYHHQTVHGRTVGAFTIGNLLVHDTFGPHQRLVFGRTSLPELEKTPPDQWDASAYPNHTRTAHAIFPNTTVAGVMNGFLSISQVYPGPTPGSNITRMMTLCAKKPETEAEIAAAEEISNLTDQALRTEDYPLGESIEMRLKSGANRNLIFGRNEPGLQHYHRTVSQLSGIANEPTVSDLESSWG